MTDDDSKKPRRRALRYSLRTLLVLVTLLCVILGNRASQFARQRQAASAIRSRGGTVVYFDDAYGRRGHGSETRAWLREFFGLRWPNIVFLHGDEVTDEVLRDEVLPLRSLAAVGMTDVSVTNEGLGQLSSLESLKYVTCLRDSRSRAVLQALDEQTSIEFQDVPLQDAIEYLADLHGIPIEIDKSAVPAEQLDARSPLTHAIKNKPLRDALDELLPPNEMGWIVTYGKLVITTAAEGEKRRQAVAAVRASLPQVREIEID